MADLYAKAGNPGDSVTFQGEQYIADDQALIAFPEDIAHEFLRAVQPFGFALTQERPAAADKPQKPPKKVAAPVADPVPTDPAPTSESGAAADKPQE
ncbi:hypothetical protein KIF53_15370 [Chromobacterium subtsugae]|uniref:Uncharacterized protein n=1 Tax=Chromobacterium subtsugae TaxID=251747 RepID=A0ABS7FG42_9NEIS|nr:MULTISPECIES: hypothetical protein [Chromobacterium]KUM02774.1 hypothetical protein Cv017_01615 [Chromobacterium subtsugae]KZE84990.1 hypothetical protein AWB61_03160 [Chromobacterium sp. F49]MBW7567786.1 hypothetical protein [Chromobacterium subtsugae]MBW8289012.1 hypothetical protein [Chromobacterium subtsugae]WSE93843.1 hypothetical protein U6115_11525 [Chromobacterium subtsugae]